MVDSNISNKFLISFCIFVQIPLWSIVTLLLTADDLPDPGSNSSMVDSNHSCLSQPSGSSVVQIPLWSIVTLIPFILANCWYGSNSSMVDSNRTRFYHPDRDFLVQIPLWSIVTFLYLFQKMLNLLVQIPLWSIVTRPPGAAIGNNACSNSSMVDSNNCSVIRFVFFAWFKFLYGR